MLHCGVQLKPSLAEDVLLREECEDNPSYAVVYQVPSPVVGDAHRLCERVNALGGSEIVALAAVVVYQREDDHAGLLGVGECNETLQSGA